MSKHKFSSFSSFVLRTPRLSFDKLLSILHNKVYLKEWIKDESIQEALFLGSPTVYQELLKYLNNEPFNKKEKERLLYTIVKYLSRMSTRCTPFGLFSGCAVGIINEKTNIVLDNTYKRLTRLDMYYLCSLANKICNDPTIKNKIKFYANNTLYKIDNQYRYIEYSYKKEKRIHQIIKVESNKYLDFIINIAKEGILISKLVYLTCNHFSLNSNEVEEYVDELICSQILLSEFEPSITGDDYLSRIINLLKTNEIKSDLSDILNLIHKRLILLDEGETNKIDIYNNIINNIKSLSLPYEKSYLFQTDMVKVLLHNTLSINIIKEIEDAIEFLNNYSIFPENEALKQFQNAFTERYEEEEIPLSVVLDPDLGIGYPVGKIYDNSNLLRDFILPSPSNQRDHSFDLNLLKKIEHAIQNNEKIIDLTKENISTNKSVKKFPTTFYSIFRVISYSTETKLISLDFVGGSSGANLLSRFAYSDNSIKKFVDEITQFDKIANKNKIPVEIVHLPESRIGNILGRPHIRDYEFIYSSFSDLNLNHQLNITDLTLTVRHGRIIIKSKSLNKEILPILSTAHNYTYESTPIYRFLCDMQFYETKSGCILNLGNLAYTFPYIPRIKYKNVILYPARWLIEVKELVELFKSKNKNITLNKINEWIKNKQLPKWVLLVEGDNKLFIDFTSELSIYTFYTTIKNRETILLEEFLIDEQNGIIKDKQGNNYLNEFIIAFKNNQYNDK